MPMVTCGFCRESFEEDTGQRACRSCPLQAGCSFVRCPHCGFENPSTPAWLLRLRGWLDGNTAELTESDALADERALAGVP